jgi:hypothetical protein
VTKVCCYIDSSYANFPFLSTKTMGYCLAHECAILREILGDNYEQPDKIFTLSSNQ